MKRSVIIAVFFILATFIPVRAQEATSKTQRPESTSVIEIAQYPETPPLLETTEIIAKSVPKSFEPYVYRANFSQSTFGLNKPTESFRPLLPLMKSVEVPSNSSPADLGEKPVVVSKKFDWSNAIKQSMFFLAIQHGYAVTQPKTQSALKGPFFRDYFDSVRSLHGWDDGGRFFTNYVAHPLQGAFAGFIQVHNDPKGKALTLSNSKAYWKSRAKALAWSAAWSTQFEIGPISQASTGNVGLQGKQTWGDIVVTPTVGTVILIAEDAADKYLIRPIESWTKNYFVRIFARMLLNPTRTMANLVRLEIPWHRDKGLR